MSCSKSSSEAVFEGEQLLVSVPGIQPIVDTNDVTPINQAFSKNELWRVPTLYYYYNNIIKQ